MRLLSSQEKDLCRRILEGHGRYNCIPNLIDSDLSGVLINLNRIAKIATIEIPISKINLSDDETEVIIGQVKCVSQLILVTVNLIILLEKEGYILTYSSVSQEDGQSRFGQGVGNSEQCVDHQLPDKKITELLIEYSSKDILVTDEFLRFCNNGFIARDEQRFKKQITVAYTALVVALLAAFVNLFFNLYKVL